MDTPSHAPLMKQCFECRQWLLLTQANWPKSSREDPCESCCRTCCYRLGKDEGESDKESLDASFDLLKLNQEDELETSSLYVSCQEKASSESTCSSTTSTEVVHTASTDTPPSQADPSRSTMASRWAIKTVDKEPKTQPKPQPSKPSKAWFKAREDLFSGQATVDIASSDLFKTLPGHPEKKPLAKKVSKANGTYVAPRVQADSEIIGTNMARSERMAPHNRSMSRSSQKPALLTGANVTAIGGDNGWGDRSSRLQVMEKFKLDLPTARGHETPPHYTFATGTASHHQNGFEGNDSGYGMSPESKRRLASSDHQHIPDYRSPSQSNNLNTDYLLEAIARMERENMGMLSPLHAETSTRDSDLYRDDARQGQMASGWD